MHDFVARVAGKYRNRPGLRFLSQINASEGCGRVTTSIRYIESPIPKIKSGRTLSVHFRSNVRDTLMGGTASKPNLVLHC